MTQISRDGARIALPPAATIPVVHNGPRAGDDHNGIKPPLPDLFALLCSLQFRRQQMNSASPPSHYADTNELCARLRVSPTVFSMRHGGPALPPQAMRVRAQLGQRLAGFGATRLWECCIAFVASH